MTLSSPPMHLAVQWPRLGPYHIARLRALNALLTARGDRLTAIETASNDRLYAWREEASTAFDRVQVFPGRIYDDLRPRELHDHTTRVLDRLDPDAVAITSYGLPDARACLAWCRRHRRIAIVMNDSRSEDIARHRWKEWIKRRLVSQFDAGIVSGTPHRRYHARLGIPGEVLFDGYSVVDNDYFAAAAAEARTAPETFRTLPGLSDSRPYFLASSRFIPRKDLDVLLRGYGRYRGRTSVPKRLILLGDGPERSRLEAIVAAEGLHDDVTLPGFRQIDDLPAYYAFATAFIHTAASEQWGLVVNEAMACGLPVIVTQQTGCSEDLVEGKGTGLTFPAGDVAALARCFDSLDGPSARRAGKAARALISEWDLDRFTRNMVRAIEAGKPRAHRGLSPIAAAIVHGLRRMPSSRAFHGVEM